MPWIGSSGYLAAAGTSRSRNRLILKSLQETLVNGAAPFS